LVCDTGNPAMTGKPQPAGTGVSSKAPSRSSTKTS